MKLEENPQIDWKRSLTDVREWQLRSVYPGQMSTWCPLSCCSPNLELWQLAWLSTSLTDVSAGTSRMLSSARKASLRAWSEGVKYCWWLEDWAEADPAVPPDQSISRGRGLTLTGPEADLSWPRRCEDWGTQTDTGQSQLVTTRGAAQQLCVSDHQWGGRTQVFHPRVRAQGHESCQEQLQCWHMREEFRESPDLVGIESTHSTSAVKKW